METKKTSDAATRTQNMRRGNETGCVHKSRGGLFDIVKQDGAATVLGRRCATMAVAEGEELGSNVLRCRNDAAAAA